MRQVRHVGNDRAKVRCTLGGVRRGISSTMAMQDVDLGNRVIFRQDSILLLEICKDRRRKVGRRIAQIFEEIEVTRLIIGRIETVFVGRVLQGAIDAISDGEERSGSIHLGA